MDVKEKVAVVTGGSKGIGKAVCEELIERGAVVYSLARHESTVDNIKNKIVDITDREACKRVINEIRKEEGTIDILVNNAGIMEDAMIRMVTQEMIEKLFATNVYAVIYLTQLVGGIMQRKRSGSIINLASIIGTNGNAGQSVYSATKGAVISFTKSIAKELAPMGIRVNAVAPGIIDTALIENVSKEKMEQRIQGIGLGRIGTPQDVAKIVAFLASDESEYISGQIIGVDGCAVL